MQDQDVTTADAVGLAMPASRSDLWEQLRHINRVYGASRLYREIAVGLCALTAQNEIATEEAGCVLGRHPDDMGKSRLQQILREGENLGYLRPAFCV